MKNVNEVSILPMYYHRPTLTSPAIAMEHPTSYLGKEKRGKAASWSVKNVERQTDDTQCVGAKSDVDISYQGDAVQTTVPTCEREVLTSRSSCMTRTRLLDMERQIPIQEELANIRAIKPALVRRSGGIAGNVQMKKFERDIKLLDEQIRQSEKHFFSEQKDLLTRLDRLKAGRNSIVDQNGRKFSASSSEPGIHRGHLVPRPPNHGGPLLDRRAQLMHKIDQQTARFHKEDKKEEETEAFRKTPVRLKPLPENYKPKIGQNKPESCAKEPAGGESDRSSQDSRPSQTCYTVCTAGSSSYHSATTTVATLSEPAKRTRKMSYAGLPSMYNNTGQAQSKSWDEATTPAKPRPQRRVSLPSRLSGLGKTSSDHLPQAPEHLHSWLGLRTQATLDRMRGQPKDEMALYQPRGKKKGSF
ncbi:hypothetical protein Bbelb_335500 [Branchiostoma belcheri]|nr:hypothetical protein Bbelb_335500 [Branchiostoma belcheri]